MIFDITAKKLIGYEPSKPSENLRKNFVAFIRGLISFPMDIPGTAYHECMKVHNMHRCAQCLLTTDVRSAQNCTCMRVKSTYDQSMASLKSMVPYSRGRTHSLKTLTD
jgi:hypothetical protein